MNDFLLLIDGSSLLTTQFFGNLPREILFAKTLEEKEAYFHKIMMTSQGVYTNAVFGFLRTLFKICKEQKPSHLAVAWDMTRDTFRRELYPEYKGNRGDTMAPLRDQFILCQKSLDKMGVCQFMDSRFEADDFCGTLAAKFEHEIPVRILTKDQDYLQLATDQTQIWMMHSTAEKTEELLKKYQVDKEKENVPDRVFLLTPERIQAEYGVLPASIAALKGLMGDSSDNIKGVHGVGKESAVKLIQEYGSIEALYQAIEGLDKKKEKELKEYWKEKLGLKRSPLSYLLKESDTELVGKKAALLSETLATICKTAPVSCSLDDLKTSLNPDGVQAVLEELEFHSLTFTNETEKKKEPWPLEQACLIEDFEEALSCIEQMKKKAEIGLQLYTDEEEVYALSLFSKDRCLVIKPIFFITSELLKEWARELVKTIPCVYTEDSKALMHRLSLDALYGIWDISIAAYLLNPLKSAYPLEEVSKQYLDWKIEGYAELFGKKKIKEAVEEPAFLSYLYKQVIAAGMLGDVLKQELEKTDMLSLYKEIELPTAFALYQMECAGICVKKEALAEYGKELQGTIQVLEQEIYALANETFNILSPKQLGEVLFEKLGLPFGKKTKTGYSTSADVLEKLEAEYPIVAKILEYRQLTKLKSTYADGLAACIRSDGRIHGTFNQTITATGRISSTEPNLQNIPVRMELGRAIRKVFVPKEGCIFLDADYSQIELRILAHMSKDPGLIAAYRSAKDIHTLTASQVFHVPEEEVTSLQRRNAKAVNFGIVYGISAFGLSEDLSISRREALDYIERYFETYPGVKAFLDRMIEEGNEQEFVTTLYGRRRPIPELKSAQFMQRQFGERVAMNSPIQGTAADIMKIAMLRVNKRLKEEGCCAKIVLQVHDELLLEVPKEEKELVSTIMIEEMQAAAQLDVCLEVSLSEGESWYETK